MPEGGTWGRQLWGPGGRRAGASVPAGPASRNCWCCHGYQTSLPPSLPASPSSSDQAFPGTKAPGCHGNGFQAPTAGFPIGWQSLQVKVTLGVTSRSQSRFKVPQAREVRCLVGILIFNPFAPGADPLRATWVLPGTLATPPKLPDVPNKSNALG